MIEQSGRGPAVRAALGIALLVLVVIGSGLVTKLIQVPTGWATSLGAWLDFYGGVLALVSLSLATMAGLAARDRMLLNRRTRYRMQSTHRTVAATTLGFLAIHIGTQLVDRHVRATDVIVPFLGGQVPAVVSLGSVAAYLLVLVAASGMARGWLTARGAGGLWRAVHAGGYLTWPIAILHGMTAGRHPAVWVMAGYAVCLVATGVVLIARWMLGPVVSQRPLTAAIAVSRRFVVYAARPLAVGIVLVIVASAVGVGEATRRSSLDAPTHDVSHVRAVPSPAVTPHSVTAKPGRSKRPAAVTPTAKSTKGPAVKMSLWRPRMG